MSATSAGWESCVELSSPDDIAGSSSTIWSATSSTVLADPVLFIESATFTVTLYNPGVANVCIILPSLSASLAPSLKSQSNEYGSSPLDTVALNSTVAGALTVSVALSSSVTFNDAGVVAAVMAKVLAVVLAEEGSSKYCSCTGSLE